MHALAARCLFPLLLLSIPVPASAAPPFPPGLEAREAKLMARLKPAAQDWFKREAGKARVTNLVSEAEAARAVRSAGAGLDLAGMSVEDAVVLLMMTIARDAREDMRQMLAEMDQTRQKKTAMREAQEQQKAGKDALNRQLRQDYAAQQTRPVIQRSSALEAFLNAQRLKYDALAELSQEQQLKMQRVLDRMTKAEAAASNVLKKANETQSAIIQNIK